MTSQPDGTAVQNPVDPLLTALIEAFLRTANSGAVLPLCEELAAVADRNALRTRIQARLDQLTPVATEPAAGLICCLLGITVVRLPERGRLKWVLTSDIGSERPIYFVEELEAFQEAVLRTFPRKLWECNVDLGIVRIRYWAWALVEALKSLDEIHRPNH